MIPWMRGQLAEAWQNRRSSRTAERQSLALSSTTENDSPGINTMIVQPTTVLDMFVVNVISLDGNVLRVSVNMEFTIVKIKTIAIQHFYGKDMDLSESISKFRLVHSAMQKQLIDDCSIKDQDIKEHDELILVENHSVPEKENLSEYALRGPSEEDIMAATANLAILNPPRPVPLIDCPVDFQSGLRKVLITLVTASAKILMYSPDVKRYCEIVREKIENQQKSNMDPKIAKDLKEMGFSEKKIFKVLRLRNYRSNMSEVLEWLIQHQDDADDSDSNDEIDLPNTKPESKLIKTDDDPSSSKIENHDHIQHEENLLSLVNVLLENYRKCKKLDFKPNQKLLSSFLEMGFEEKSIIQALKITGNDYSNACEWLLGERRDSLRDLDDGLDPDGRIYKAIMSNPHIQLSLTNPRMLIAYLTIIERPTSMNVWMNDPDASPVIRQILKTYHVEKHAINVNHFRQD